MTKIETTGRGTKPVLRYILAAVALVFGAATIKAGGDVLFFNEQAKASAGNYVPFVLWANFIGGFLYVTAGLLILFKSTQALRLSAAIAALTIAVFVAFGVHILLGGAYEMRTLAAMGFRSAVWVIISLVLHKAKLLARRS